MSNFAFEGRDLRVRVRPCEGSPCLVVTFTGRAAKPPVPLGFGERFLERRGISAIHFISTWNHWWQTPEVEEAIALLRAQGHLAGGLPLVMYGSSMGGYAAMRWSREFAADRIVAVSPQFSIDPQKVPFEKRWRNYAARIRFNFDDMAAGISHQARLQVVVDPLFVPDWQHVQRVQQLRPVEVLATSFAGHNTARALEEVGVVSAVMQEALLGRLAKGTYLREYRQRRRHSSLVWFGLAQLQLARGRPGLATVAATLAATLLAQGTRMGDPPLRLEIFDLAFRCACDDGYESLAAEWLAQMRAQSPASPATLRAGAMAALAFGDLAACASALAALQPLGDGNTLQLRHRLLVRLGRPAEAAAVLEQAPDKVAATAAVQSTWAGRHLARGDAQAAVAAATRAHRASVALLEPRLLLLQAQRACGDLAGATATARDIAGWTVTAGAQAELLATQVQGLLGKVAAHAVRLRTRRARWIQELLVEQLAQRRDLGPEAWMDQALSVIGARMASRLRRLAQAAREAA